MNAALSLFVVALLGAESAPHQGTPPIEYRVKLVEMDGLKWRESLYVRFQPVARQGSYMVWTADRDTAKALVDQASRVLMNPQVLAESGGVAAYTQRTTRKVASQLTRHADGPVDHALAVAYTTNHEDLREGCQFTMSGRKLDQGMLVKMVVEELRVAAVHQVKLTEHVTDHENKDRPVTLNPQLEVPEVVRASLEGEWLIPNEGVLVASLGAHTLADAHGKAVVRERLLVVEAAPVSARTVLSGSNTASRVFTYVAPARAVTIPMPARDSAPVPAVPSRSLPMARNAEGVPVPLPPLPEAPVPPSSIPGTTEPCATPQTAPQRKSAGEVEEAPSIKSKQETRSLDIESQTASYQPEPKPSASEVAPAPASSKPYRFRLPLGPGLEIEINAKVAPAANP